MICELLEAIIAAPEDDAPRRVYADALLESDDPLGELIHLQLDLAGRSLTPDERAVRQRREHELLATHEERWVAPLAALTADAPAYAQIAAPTARFRRGFIDEIRIDADIFARRGEELFAISPLVRGVELDGIYEEDAADWVFGRYAAAMRSPVLSRLHGLRCTVGSWTVEGYDSQTFEIAMADRAMPILLDAAARMPHLRALAMFDPEAELTALLESGLLARLHHLDLYDFKAGDAMTALEAASGLTSLRLPLLNQQQLVALLSHPRLRQIEDLSLERPLFDHDLDVIAEIARTLPRLRRLEIGDTGHAAVDLDLELEEVRFPKRRIATVFGW